MGISVREWEQMTPAELSLYADAYVEQNEMREAYLYTLAALIRPMIWSEHPPEFESVFRSARKRKEMTDEQMFAVVQALNRQFGGVEVD